MPNQAAAYLHMALTCLKTLHRNNPEETCRIRPRTTGGERVSCGVVCGLIINQAAHIAASRYELASMNLDLEHFVQEG